MFSNWFKRQVNNIKTQFDTTIKIARKDQKPADSSEIMRVVNKFASIFMDAEITVQDENENIKEAPTQTINKLLSTDPLYKGKSSFLNQLCKVAILQGGAIIKKTIVSNEILSFDLLEPCHITATKDHRQNRLTIMNFREFFLRLYYNDYYTSNVVTLVNDEISFFVDHPNYNNELLMGSRLFEIQQKINNSYYANNMLSSLMNRCAILFLSRDNKNEFTTLNTTTETAKRTENFTDSYHVQNSAVVPVGDNMRAVNTNINAKATGVFDAFEDTINATCNLLGITRSIIEIQGSTFANQQGAIKDAIANGIQSFADKVSDFLTSVLVDYAMIEKGEKVVFDYTEVLAKNLADSSQDIQNIENQTTQTTTQTQTQEN